VLLPDQDMPIFSDDGVPLQQQQQLYKNPVCDPNTILGYEIVLITYFTTLFKVNVYVTLFRDLIC